MREYPGTLTLGPHILSKNSAAFNQNLKLCTRKLRGHNAHLHSDALQALACAGGGVSMKTTHHAHAHKLKSKSRTPRAKKNTKSKRRPLVIIMITTNSGAFDLPTAVCVFARNEEEDTCHRAFDLPTTQTGLQYRRRHMPYDMYHPPPCARTHAI